MFISKTEKKEILDRIRALENNIHELVHAVKTMQAQAPYGRCKDGTPRAKPGMKTGQRKAVAK
jgi:hypothetical protein